MELDGIAAIRGYVDRLVTGDDRCRGMKVLLLDSATTEILSCVSSQSEVLSKEVYLVSRLDDARANPNLSVPGRDDGINSLALDESTDSKMGHMKAVCFVRPTEINVGLLVRELTTSPRFAEYHIFFSGVVSPMLLDLLAENDPGERVRQVQEFYADFLPINPDLWSLNCRNTIVMNADCRRRGRAGNADIVVDDSHAHLYQRNLTGLQSMLLASKRQPAAIRCQKSSALAQKLAADVRDAISNDDIFHFRRGSGKPGQSARGVGGRDEGNHMLLLVLDRMDDPVTPLLSQWTYQGMVHELLGLNNNRVVMRGVPNVTKDLEEVVLSSAPGQDAFFVKNRNANFGELGESIKNLLEDYQKKSKEHDVSKLTSIEDMQSFMDKYPELRSQSHNVSKHVAIMGELARLVEVCSLLDVSAFEQDLACADDPAGHLKELMSKLNSPAIKIPDKLRLGMLYALRYENAGQNNALPAVKEAMKRGGVQPEMLDLVDAVLRYAGASVRGPGLYGTNKDIMSKMTKSFMTSVQGVSNVYSQHSPVLIDTLEAIAKGKLRGDTHPLVSSSGSGTSAKVENLPVPQEVLIFMLGGVTYEEETKVREFNQTNSGKIRVVLGGSTVHNSTSFLEELKMI